MAVALAVRGAVCVAGGRPQEDALAGLVAQLSAGAWLSGPARGAWPRGSQGNHTRSRSVCFLYFLTLPVTEAATAITARRVFSRGHSTTPPSKAPQTILSECPRRTPAVRGRRGARAPAEEGSGQRGVAGQPDVSFQVRAAPRGAGRDVVSWEAPPLSAPGEPRGLRTGERGVLAKPRTHATPRTPAAQASPPDYF